MKPDGSLPKSMNWHLPNTVTISGPLGIGKNSSLYLPGGPLWVWESKTRPTIFWVHLFMSRAVRWWRMLLQWALVGFLLQCAPDEQLRWVGSWHWWLSSYLRHLSDKFPSWLRAIGFFICLFEWRTKWRDWPGSGMKWRHLRLLENMDLPETNAAYRTNKWNSLVEIEKVRENCTTEKDVLPFWSFLSLAISVPEASKGTSKKPVFSV